MKTNFSHLISFALTIILLSACGPRQPETLTPFRITLTYRAANPESHAPPQPEDILATMEAYTPRPTMIPTGTPVPPTLTPAIPSSVNSICLNISQSFGEAEGKPPSVYELASRVLGEYGYSVLEPGQECDASLDINLILWPLGEKYQVLGGSGSRTCYTGSKATGSASLTLTGRDPQTIELATSYGPITGMVVIISTCPSPSAAPFENSARTAVLQALSDLIGPQILVTAAKDEDEYIRIWAIWEMYSLYTDEKIYYPIPEQVMLEALEDPSSRVRSTTITVLGQMGEDADFAFDKLVSLLQDPEAEVRRNVVIDLDRIRRDDPSLLEPYLTALQDVDEDVASQALSELCSLGSISLDAVPQMLDFFESHPSEAYRLNLCLSEVTGENLGNDISAWRTWWEQKE
jgi:hypothetical protein